MTENAVWAPVLLSHAESLPSPTTQTQTPCISPPVCEGARRTAETPVTGKRFSLVLSATNGRGPAHRGHAPLLIVTRADGVTARRCQRPLWKHFWKVSVDTWIKGVRRYIADAYVHGVHYDAV
jgi:hypothetical protein